MNSDLWRSFLQQHQQSLKHEVGETRPDGDVVQQTLNVIHHHAAELRLVGVIEDLRRRSEEMDKGKTGRENDSMSCCPSAFVSSYAGGAVEAALTFLIAWHLEISECPIILSGEQILMKGNSESSAI